MRGYIFESVRIHHLYNPKMINGWVKLHDDRKGRQLHRTGGNQTSATLIIPPHVLFRKGMAHSQTQIMTT